MPWKSWIRGLMLILVSLIPAFLVSCQKLCFLTEADYQENHLRDLPPCVETDPSLSLTALAGTTPPPTTVIDTKRNVRYLSLREAVAIALEHGTVGSQSVTTPGGASDSLVSFQGSSVSGDDSIRVLALDPAIIATNIEASLSKFDARWDSSLSWTRAENPIGSSTAVVGTASPLESINSTNINLSSRL